MGTIRRGHSTAGDGGVFNQVWVTDKTMVPRRKQCPSGAVEANGLGSMFWGKAGEWGLEGQGVGFLEVAKISYLTTPRLIYRGVRHSTYIK